MINRSPTDKAVGYGKAIQPSCSGRYIQPPEWNATKCSLPICRRYAVPSKFPPTPNEISIPGLSRPFPVCPANEIFANRKRNSPPILPHPAKIRFQLGLKQRRKTGIPLSSRSARIQIRYRPKHPRRMRISPNALSTMPAAARFALYSHIAIHSSMRLIPKVHCQYAVSVSFQMALRV